GPCAGWISGRSIRRAASLLLTLLIAAFFLTSTAFAQGPPQEGGGEASLVLPDLGSQNFVGVNGRTLLLIGMGVALLGLVFGFITYGKLRGLPVHRSMREISELIYETCKTYLLTQGRFLMLLWVFIA